MALITRAGKGAALTYDEMDANLEYLEGLTSPRLPIRQNTTITHTGTISPTIIASYSVPSGTFGSNDILRYRWQTSQIDNRDAKSIKFYFNETATLSGATLVATQLLNDSVSNAGSRDFVFKNSLTSQETQDVTVSIADDENKANTAITALTVDFEADQYFLVVVELLDPDDEVKLRWLHSEVI